MLQMIQTWLAANPALATLILWPIVTAFLNFVFHSLESSSNKIIQGAAVLLKTFGVDSPKVIRWLHSLLDKQDPPAPPPPPAVVDPGAIKAIGGAS